MGQKVVISNWSQAQYSLVLCTDHELSEPALSTHDNSMSHIEFKTVSKVCFKKIIYHEALFKVTKSSNTVSTLPVVCIYSAVHLLAFKQKLTGWIARFLFSYSIHPIKTQ